MSIETSDQHKLHLSRQVQLDKSQIYISEFLKQANPSHDFVINNCPTCGKDDCSVLFEKNQGQYAYCNSCKHIFLRKSLSPSKLLQFYSDYPTSSLDWHQNESEFYERVYSNGLKLISSVINGEHLLDIGCSSGYFLSIASRQGFICSGVEPNILESNYAVKNGINVVGSTIHDIPSATKYNVITLWDVLEHISDPISYLTSLRQFLSEDGCIFVQVPTSDSLAARIMREKCNMFDGIEHLTLFSKYSLNIAFIQAGFTPKTSCSIISDDFAINNYLSYEEDPYLPVNVSGSPDILGAFTKNNLSDDGLGYKIQACYQITQRN